MSGRSQQQWKRIKVDPGLLRPLMQRQDARPMRDMLFWLGLMGLFMGLTIYLWGSWWAALPLYAYAVLYSTGSQSREHETGHGTAFKSKAYNKFFFELTSFMVLRESFLRTKSHDTHHQHTILTDKDPEIVTPTPPNYRALLLNLFMIERSFNGVKDIAIHSLNKLTAKDRKNGLTALPDGALTKARLWGSYPDFHCRLKLISVQLAAADVGWSCTHNVWGNAEAYICAVTACWACPECL